MANSRQVSLLKFLLVVLLPFNFVMSAPNTDDCLHHDKDYSEYPHIEIFNVEHEVSSSDAKNAARAINPNELETPAGCQPCTRQEINYCSGVSLMNDHCCCDRRFQETFPHVPHTCYIGEKLCKPIARDCGEYARLRACCCDQHVALKWKSLSIGSCNHLSITAMSVTLILSIFSF